MASLTIDQLPWTGPDYLIPWEVWDYGWYLAVGTSWPPEFAGEIYFQLQNTSLSGIDFTVESVLTGFKPYQIQAGEILTANCFINTLIADGFSFVFSGPGTVLKNVDFLAHDFPAQVMPFWTNSRGQSEVL